MSVPPRDLTGASVDVPDAGGLVSFDSNGEVSRPALQLAGHGGRVLSLATDRDGLCLLSGDELGRILVWDLDTGALISTLKEHVGAIWSIAVTPNGRYAVSTSSDGSLGLWHLGTGSLIRSYRDASGTSRGVAVSPDGHSILSGGDDSIVRLRDIQTGRLIRAFRGHAGRVHAVAIHEGGSFALSGSLDETVRLWDLERGKAVRTMRGHRRPVLSVAITPDGSRGVSGSMDRTVKVWDLSSGRLVRTLEGHTSAVYSVAVTPDGGRIVSASGDHTIRLWSLEGGRLLRTIRNDSDVNAIAVLPDGERVVSGDDAQKTSVWDIRPLGLKADDGSHTEYMNAKVVLVGDSGVGKSGLRLVLAGRPFEATISTHGRFVEHLATHSGRDGGSGQEEREILLWDLAGQPGYRLIHQLQLREVSVALVVFDAVNATDPFSGVMHWHRALTQSQRSEGESALPLTKILVAARADRGSVPVSRQRIDAFVAEHGFDRFVETSAKTGEGIQELLDIVEASIDWGQLPRVTSSELFESIKESVLAARTAGDVLLPKETLYRRFVARHSVPADDELRDQFDTCLGRLDARGIVRRLEFGGLVLLQPELLDAYASSIVEAAKSEPDGLGCISEARVLEAKIRMDPEERIDDPDVERLLLHATVKDLLAYEVALLEGSEDGDQLIFPSQLTKENPALPDPPGKSSVIRFEGPLLNIYATLAVRLSHSGHFKRKSLWRNAAVFTPRRAGECGLYLREVEEGRGEIITFYTEDTPEYAKAHFEEYLLLHLARHAIPESVSARRVLACPDCGTVMAEAQVKKRRELGKDDMICPVCERRVDIREEAPDGSTGEPDTAAVAQMDQLADAERDLHATRAVLRAKLEVEDFDVFLCHNSRDKPSVKSVGEALKRRGVLPWLDEERLRPGLPWQDELDRQLESIKSVAVFVGPAGVGPWQEEELRQVIRGFVKRRLPVIPVILGDAPEQPELPSFLQGMTWVDFRASQPDPLERLVYGITGEHTLEAF